jgi:hypothetical protein
MVPGGCGDNSVGQFDFLGLTYLNGKFCDSIGDMSQNEARQKFTHVVLISGARSDQHLHPGKNADTLVRVARQFAAGFAYSFEVVDQNVRVEQGPHHSLRIDTPRLRRPT